jgi:multicomponent Na+:H+ antiporter subunit D
MPEFLVFSPVLLIFIPIFTALIIYVIDQHKMSFLVFGGQALITVVFVAYLFFLAVNPDANTLVFGGWDERIGIGLLNDRTSLAFIALTIFIWWIVLLYTFNTNRKETKFLFFLMFLQGIFLGLIQTNDLFNMFVFLELITVLVTILITYKKSGPSFRAGIYYLLLNTIGAMVFLIGVILLYYVYGTINIQLIRENIALHSNTTTVKLAYIMMIAGISVKGALFPVFTWLPKAHGVAQSTISALLSGLIVKGALYMFIRINNEMFAFANYQTNALFFWIGATTAIVGVIFALSQKEMKQILAYHTISQVGIMMMGLSSLSPEVQFAGFLHIFNHAFFKSLLFLGTGMIIKVYQSKKVTDVRGVMKTMPVVAVVMIVGMLSISGSPMFNGFVSKSIVKYGFKDETLKTILFWIINLGTTTSFIKFSQILFGPKKDLKMERNIKQNASIILLAAACLAVGIVYIPLTEWFAGLDISNVKWLSFNSFLDYGIFLASGFIFYKLLIEKDYIVTRKIRELKITFENANYLFVLYLAVLALFVMRPFV